MGKGSTKAWRRIRCVETGEEMLLRDAAKIIAGINGDGYQYVMKRLFQALTPKGKRARLRPYGFTWERA